MKCDIYLMSSKTLVTQNSICYYCLICGRKAVTNLDTIKKQRHYFAYKVPYSQSHGFSRNHIWMWKLDHKEGWVLLRIPWNERRSNQSILKEINPQYSLEGLMLKLKLRYFGCLMWRATSLEKTLMLGKIEGRRRRGQQRMRFLDASLTQWTWVWANSRR